MFKVFPGICFNDNFRHLLQDRQVKETSLDISCYLKVCFFSCRLGESWLDNALPFAMLVSKFDCPSTTRLIFWYTFWTILTSFPFAVNTLCNQLTVLVAFVSLPLALLEILTIPYRHNYPLSKHKRQQPAWDSMPVIASLSPEYYPKHILISVCPRTDLLVVRTIVLLVIIQGYSWYILISFYLLLSVCIWCIIPLPIWLRNKEKVQPNICMT